MSDGSITLGIPSFAAASNAYKKDFLQQYLEIFALHENCYF
jgi:hypothetical protein